MRLLMRVCLVACSTVVLCSAPAAAATLVFNSSGLLTGARGVEVDGSLYDVTFVDSTCADAFDGCDELTDFQFTTFDAAMAATQVLDEEVLVDGPLGDFDSHPTSIAGCFIILTDFCQLATPYGLNGTLFKYIGLQNRDASGIDTYVDTSALAAQTNFASLNGATLARWTPAATAEVPEPTSMILLGTGLLGLATRRVRAQRSA